MAGFPTSPIRKGRTYGARSLQLFQRVWHDCCEGFGYLLKNCVEFAGVVVDEAKFLKG
jgi:hypothetical protein